MVDAWFDVTTARHGAFVQSLVFALALEIPSAAFLFWITWRTVKELADSMFVVPEVNGVPIRKIRLVRRFDKSSDVTPSVSSETTSTTEPKIKKKAFDLIAAAVAAQTSLGDHAMTGHDDRPGIHVIGVAHRARRAGTIYRRGDVGVRAYLAEGNSAELRPHIVLERSGLHR